MLSEKFKALHASAQREGTEKLSLYQIDETLGEDASPLLTVFLCIPFLFPMPLPGVSTVFGLAIIFLALREFFPKSSKLPRFLGNREVSSKLVLAICHKGTKLLLRFERFVHPRLFMMLGTVGRLLAALAIISSSIALALPIPPIIPFTNFLPATAILLLAIAELQDDGLSSLLGHFMHFVSWVYIALVGSAAFVSLEKLGEHIKMLLGSP